MAIMGHHLDLDITVENLHILRGIMPLDHPGGLTMEDEEAGLLVTIEACIAGVTIGLTEKERQKGETESTMMTTSIMTGEQIGGEVEAEAMGGRGQDQEVSTEVGGIGIGHEASTEVEDQEQGGAEATIGTEDIVEIDQGIDQGNDMERGRDRAPSLCEKEEGAVATKEQMSQNGAKLAITEAVTVRLMAMGFLMLTLATMRRF